MKSGFRNLLGMGFLAALSAMAFKGKEQSSVEANSPFGQAKIAHGSPVWMVSSMKSKKSNRLRYSHNAKVKRRKSR